MALPPARSRRDQLNWYLALLVLFLFITVPPFMCGLLYLSQVPDVVWERDNGLTFDRVWMYRTRRPVGVGYQSQRVLNEVSPDEVCVQNRVRFLLWGKAEGVVGATSSQTVVRTGGQWQPTGQPCR